MNFNIDRYIKKETTIINKLNKKFAAADIESIVINGEHIPFMISWTIDGINIQNKCITEYSESKIDEKTILEGESWLIRSMINDISKHNKHTKITTFMHNMGNFDGIMIFRNIINIDEYRESMTNPIIRNNSFYEIGVKSIRFRDSYKLLPVSLNKLAKEFLGQQKDDLDISDGFSIDDINNKNYIKKIIKYCNKDTQLLWQIMDKFQNDTFNIWPNIDTNKYITITKIALSIWKRNYIEDNTVGNSSKFYNYIKNTIRNSYKGGITEVYKPYGTNLLYYDINSAYPYAMMELLPTGLPETVNFDDLDENTNPIEWLNKFFGFLTVKINVEKTYIPFLGLNIDNKNKYIYGTFVTTLFSEELKYAMKVNNIKIIKIISAIKFNKGYPMKKFAHEIYNLRVTTKKSSEKQIFKMILNSLYGRLGMRDDFEKIMFVNTETLQKLRTFEIEDFLNMTIIFQSTNQHIVKITENKNHKKPNRDEMLLIKDFIKSLTKHNKIMNFNKDSAIQLASAITAYARINIDKHKRSILDKGGEIFYSDTDSIITNTEMETSNKLGDLKLENTIEEGYFMAPKAYAMKINNKWHIKIKGLSKKTIEKEENTILNIFKDNINNINNDNNITDSKPIAKNFKNMKLKKVEKVKNITLNLNKRDKIWKNNIWIDTTPQIFEKY